MKADILKRLKAVENRARVLSDDVPELIMIFYREDLKQWIVASTYCCGKDRYNRTEQRFDDLKNYRLPDKFTGVCLLDDLSAPEVPGGYFSHILGEENYSDCTKVYRSYV